MEDRLQAVREGTAGAWSLTDLIDVATLQSIQDTFARTFGLPTVILLADGSNATEITHRVSFCEDLTRTSPVSGPRCTGCDRGGMKEAEESGHPAIFKCWNGLYDCAIPIAPNGETLGYFLCGQVFAEAPDPDVYRETALEIGVQPDEYVRALDDVRVVSYDRYRASVESMHVLAQMIAEQAAAAMDNYRMLQDAVQAKDDAARLMEELDAILEAFTDIGSQPDHSATLDAIADNLGRLIEHDSCIVYLLDEEGDHLSPVVVRDPHEAGMRRHKPRLGEGIVGKVAEAGTGRFITDASIDPDYQEVADVPIEPEAMLVVPMVHKGTLSGVICLSRFERKVFTEHEFRILSVVASTQAAIAIENARMQERERRRLEEYRILAALGTSLVSAQDEAQAREVLLLRSTEVFHADTCFIATQGELPGEVEVAFRAGRNVGTFVVDLSRNARLAGIRLGAERSPDRAVFDAWAAEVTDQVSERLSGKEFLAEPLTTAAGVIGGLFVGWDIGDGEKVATARRILNVIAGAAGATLSNFAVYAQTDSSLQRRVRELQAMTRLAERITGSIHEAAIIDELLSAAIELGHLNGAAFAVPGTSGWSVKQVSGLGREQTEQLNEALLRSDLGSSVVRTKLGDVEAVLVPLPGESLGGVTIGGFSSGGGGPDQDTLLATLARYGAVALENARLHDRQDQAIARLEQTNKAAADQYDRLQRLLSVHKALTVEVLQGTSLASLARSLSELVEGSVTIFGRGQMTLAVWPEGNPVRWSRPPEGDGLGATTIELEDETLVVSPVMVEGETHAWVAARLNHDPGEVDLAVVEYGALLTALDLLKEKTAIEVETRLRGGLVEELFDPEVEEETVVKQGVALGFDLTMRSRVFLLEPVSTDVTRADLESLYAAVSQVGRSLHDDTIVALRSNSVVLIRHEEDAGGVVEGTRLFEDDLLDAVKEKLPQLPVNLAVGTVCEGPRDHRASYIAARRGLDLLSLLGRAGETFSFRDAGVEHLLLQTTEPGMLMRFIDSFVTPLDEYDAGHSSNLRSTVETFYEASMNLEEAARRLHIHVSTLRYRLGKVEELLGVELKGRDRLDIELAIRSAKVFSSYRR